MLIELLVVLAILALAASLALPFLRRDSGAAEAKAAARILVADLRWLRQQALGSGRETALTLDLDARQYRRSVDDLVREFPAAVRFSHRPANPADRDGPAVIRFFSDGGSDGGEIVLAYGARRHSVRVLWPFGRIEAGDGS